MGGRGGRGVHLSIHQLQRRQAHGGFYGNDAKSVFPNARGIRSGCPQGGRYGLDPGEQRFEGGMTPTVSGAQLDMKNDLPTEVIDAPTTVGEAQAGSWKALLSRNLGNFVVATFLIGTQGTVAWEGILYDVGNNYLTIYQAGRDRYIVCDIYSLKYIEFYDTNRRQMCDELLRQRGWQPNG